MESVVSRRSVLTGLGTAGAAAGFAAVAGGAQAAQPTVRGTRLIKPTTGAGPARFEVLAAFAGRRVRHDRL